MKFSVALAYPKCASEENVGNMYCVSINWQTTCECSDPISLVKPVSPYGVRQHRRGKMHCGLFGYAVIEVASFAFTGNMPKEVKEAH